MPDGGMALLIGFVAGWFMAPVLFCAAAALLPCKPIPVVNYSDWPIECHPRYNVALGRLVD